MSTTPIVSIGRDTAEVKLFDTKGGIVKLHTALTVQEQTDILKRYEGKEDIDSKAAIGLETVIACFISWNIGKDGVAMPCNLETVKLFTQRDFFAMLQACTGKQLLDDKGNMLTQEEIEKKAARA